jgi:hypothetical protein
MEGKMRFRDPGVVLLDGFRPEIGLIMVPILTAEDVIRRIASTSLAGWVFFSNPLRRLSGSMASNFAVKRDGSERKARRTSAVAVSLHDGSLLPEGPN